MQILKYYTGNPMLNNALMTIKALVDLSSISELTTDVLKRLLMKVHKDLPYSLMDLNLRFKSYTMLFTKNGPLYNDKKLGKQIYQRLMSKIVDGFEDEGDKVCDISGLRYGKPFSQFLFEVLIDLGVPEKEALGKDLTINRCWFPLLGGLGSDAQALPMAKYTYNVHPIFIVILQFLPLSALIYRKGILLVDSSSMEFCESYIEENVKTVIDKAKSISPGLALENQKIIRGHYLVGAINIAKASKIDFGYADFNLWSFSNSGAGASCSIDRIPNKLLLKLGKLYLKHKDELVHILNDPMSANSFLDCLDANTEWFGLYPSKKGKGVTVGLFESYWEVIGQKNEAGIAKHIAYLISKYKSDAFDKYLKNVDAYDCKVYNYKDDLNKVLLEATQKGEWSFKHQLYIQDDKEAIPIRFASFKLYKLIHYYYQNEIYSDELPEIKLLDNNQARLCQWIISLIRKESEKRREDLKKRILNHRKEDYSIFDELFIRHAGTSNVNIYTVFPVLYSDEGRKDIRGLHSLLRYYYIAPVPPPDEESCSFPEVPLPDDFKKWFEYIDIFAKKYFQYKMGRVVNDEKLGEYSRKIFMSIPKEDRSKQRVWFKDALNRLNEYGKEEIWEEESLVYDSLGNYNFSTFIYAVRMKISELAYKNSEDKTNN